VKAGQRMKKTSLDAFEMKELRKILWALWTATKQMSGFFLTKLE